MYECTTETARLSPLPPTHDTHACMQCKILLDHAKFLSKNILGKNFLFSCQDLDTFLKQIKVYFCKDLAMIFQDLAMIFQDLAMIFSRFPQDLAMILP